MSHLTEDAIEQNLIDLLKNQGYRYIHGNELERSLDGVVLEYELKTIVDPKN